jgi:WD40 repeat protein
MERVGRWCRRNPALAATCGLAAAALTGVVVLSLTLAYQQSKAADDLRVRERETLAALQAVREQSVLTQRQMAFRTLDQGLTECEAGHVRKGMLTLARSLTLASELPANTGSDIEHAIRMNLAAWRNDLPAVTGLFSHDARVQAVAYSPDGAELATASRDGVIHRWNTATHESNGPEWRYPGVLNCFTYAPDGKTIAAGGDRGVLLYRAADGQVLRALEADGLIRAVAFRGDGEFLLTGGDDGVARLWRASTGEQAGSFENSSNVLAVAFTRDGSTALAGCHDGSLQFWEVATGRLLPPKGNINHPDAIVALAISADGSKLASGSNEAAFLWDLSSGTLLHWLPVQGKVRTVTFHPSRPILAAAASRQVCFWETTTGRRVGEPLLHAAEVTAVALHPSGDKIVTASVEGTALSWNMVVGREQGRALRHDRGKGVQSVGFSSDGRLALTAGRDGRPRLWDGRTGDLIYKLQGPTQSLNAVCFSPNDRMAAAGGDGRDVWIWDAASGRQIHHLSRHRAAVRVVAFSPKDGGLLASVDEIGTVILWDAASGKMLREMHHGGTIDSWAAAFSPDGRKFLTGGTAGTGMLAFKGAARLWEVASGQLVLELPHEGLVDSVAFSPDGQWIATGCNDSVARLWNVATGARIADLKHEGHVRSVAFSPDSQRLLTASFDHTVRVWSVPDGKRLASPVSHDNAVRHAAFSPDGSLFVTGSFDHTARIWDTATSRPFGPALGFRYWVVNVAFRPDGRAVLLGSSDGTARLCDVAPPVAGDPKRIRLWVEVLTGAELEGDVLRVLDGPTCQERRRRLEELKGPPE